MSERNVDSEAIEKVIKSLQKYVAGVSQDIKKMQDAATDCHDNMGKDEYSKAAVADLQKCAKNMKKALDKAEDIERDLKQLLSEF